MMKKTGIWVAIIVVAVIVYFSYDPATNALFPKCPFLLLTGLRCPGCGSQRALHSLLHFDIIAAFRYNALLVLSLPVVFTLVFAELRRKQNNALYVKLHNVKFIWGYFAATVMWWFLRNLYNV